MTGTSVLGITFKDGVMLAADTLGASLAVDCCVDVFVDLADAMSSSCSFDVRYCPCLSSCLRAGSYGSTKRYKDVDRLIKVHIQILASASMCAMPDHSLVDVT